MDSRTDHAAKDERARCTTHGFALDDDGDCARCRAELERRAARSDDRAAMRVLKFMVGAGAMALLCLAALVLYQCAHLEITFR